jgi:hypothetical protein
MSKTTAAAASSASAGASGQHHRQGLAHVTNEVFRDHRLRIGSDGRVGAAKRNGRDRVAHIGGGQNRPHSRHGQRRRGVDRAEATVGHGAAHDRGVPLPRPGEIIEILSATAQEAKVFDPLDRAADKRIGPAHRRLERGSNFQG